MKALEASMQVLKEEPTAIKGHFRREYVKETLSKHNNQR